MKTLQALYNNDANKIVEEAAQEKNVKENSTFLIDLAMVAGDTKPTEDEPQMFSETWNHKNPESQRKCLRVFKRSLGT